MKIRKSVKNIKNTRKRLKMNKKYGKDCIIDEQIRKSVENEEKFGKI